MDCEDNKYNPLEQMLLDANEEPTDLPLSLLKAITNDFSEDQKIGSGGFADVYEGVLHNGSVAVKRLFQTINMDENNFTKEVTNLIRVKHQNVVRFLGYCADTQGKIAKFDQKMVMADVQQRLLCFEFLPNGSLDKRINNNVASGGLEWRTCYQIIKGLCQGLQYLHQQNIVHLDLKPANVLLDCNMVPKISDFGLSRCFDEKQTRAVTAKVVGTLGYMAPEFIRSGVITIKSDIYSLGIIIMEILTGQKEYLQTGSALECWSTRFQMSHGGIWLELVKVCAEIGLECIDSDPVKRPTTQQIIERLDEVECTCGFNHSAIPGLDVYPLDIWFPLEPNELVKCPVTLTNRTDDLFGVWITPTWADDGCSNPDFPYVWEEHRRCDDPKSSIFKRLGPHSSETIYLTIREQEKPLPQGGKCTFDVAMVATKTKSEEDLEYLKVQFERLMQYKSEVPLTVVKEWGPAVHLEKLRVAATSDDPAWCQKVEAHQIIQEEDDRFFRCHDVHPTKPWLLGDHVNGSVSIWNYETQERVTKFQVKYLKEGKNIGFVPSMTFIAGEQWVAAGDPNGVVHIYSYTSLRADEIMDKVKEFKATSSKYTAVTALAAYPKHTLLLTACRHSYDKSVKLWDWSQGWSCARVIHVDYSLDYFIAGPRDASTFAWVSASIMDSDSDSDGDLDGTKDVAKVWDIRSPDAIATIFEAMGGFPTFYTDGHRNFLASLCCNSNTDSLDAKVWDLQTRKHVHTLCLAIQRDGLQAMASHPILPILAYAMGESGTPVRQIILWNAKTYRVMKWFELCMEGRFCGMLFNENKYATSLVVITDEEISIVKINVPTLLTSC